MVGLTIDCECSLSTAILPNTSGEVLELFAFDEEYVRKLREGEPSTEAHFVGYFTKLLQLKLRARYLPPDTIDDISQETFVRFFRTLRSENGLRQADRL